MIEVGTIDESSRASLWKRELQDEQTASGSEKPVELEEGGPAILQIAQGESARDEIGDIGIERSVPNV